MSCLVVVSNKICGAVLDCAHAGLARSCLGLGILGDWLGTGGVPPGVSTWARQLRRVAMLLLARTDEFAHPPATVEETHTHNRERETLRNVI